MVKFGLPAAGPVLVIAPHPDDEALGCAGSVMLAAGSGTPVSIVYLTGGEQLMGSPSPDVMSERTAEARSVSAMMGCTDALFLGLPDGELAGNEIRLHDALLSVLQQKRPGLVLAPSPLDYHEDHRATSRAALRLLRDPGSFILAFYEVYAAVRFTHLVDITDVAGRKTEVIRAYASSLYGQPEKYVRISLGLNAHRSMFVGRDGYYEAFWVLEGPRDTKDVVRWLTYGLGDMP